MLPLLHASAEWTGPVAVVSDADEAQVLAYTQTGEPPACAEGAPIVTLRTLSSAQAQEAERRAGLEPALAPVVRRMVEGITDEVEQARAIDALPDDLRLALLADRQWRERLLRERVRLAVVRCSVASADELADSAPAGVIIELALHLGRISRASDLGKALPGRA